MSRKHAFHSGYKPLKHRFEEHSVIFLPFGVLVVALCFGFLWHAHALYLAEYAKRVAAEGRLAAPKVDSRTATLRRMLPGYLSQGNHIVQWLRSDRFDLQREGIQTFEVWDEESKQVVKDCCPEHYPAFLENPHRSEAAHASQLLSPNVAAVASYVDEQIRKLCQIHLSVSAQ